MMLAKHVLVRNPRADVAFPSSSIRTVSILISAETVASISPSSGRAYAKALLAHTVCIRIHIVTDCTEYENPYDTFAEV